MISKGHMNQSLLNKLAEQYPFITLCIYSQNEYVGIVQNRDTTVTTIYDYGSIIDVDLKKEFVSLASTWWWESNRLVPINIFLKTEWEPFKPYLRTFSNKDLQILHGPTCSLSYLAERKSKKRSIIMVKRVK